MTRRKISDETKQLIDKLYDENLSVREIARRTNVSYPTARKYTKDKQRVNPETGQHFETRRQFEIYRRYREHVMRQIQQQPINQEQKDSEASLIATLWSLEGIIPPTKIGYNHFAALFALARNYRWGGPVFPRDISQALNANIFTPDDARLPPQGFDTYFERLRQLGLIQVTLETGYTMNNDLKKIIFDNFDRFVTPSIAKERFWNSVHLYYRLD